MNSRSLTVLDGLLRECLEGVLADSGSTLSAWERCEKRRKDELACSIGFTAEQGRGVLFLITSQAFLRATLPAGVDGSSDPGSASDWLGELCNQLLGRLKNRLIPRGISLSLSLPSVIQGAEVTKLCSRSPTALVCDFESAAGSGTVGFEAEFTGAVEIGEPEGGERAVLEGELELF